MQKKNPFHLLYWVVLSLSASARSQCLLNRFSFLSSLTRKMDRFYFLYRIIHSASVAILHCTRDVTWCLQSVWHARTPSLCCCSFFHPHFSDAIFNLPVTSNNGRERSINATQSLRALPPDMHRTGVSTELNRSFYSFACRRTRLFHHINSTSCYLIPLVSNGASSPFLTYSCSSAHRIPLLSYFLKTGRPVLLVCRQERIQIFFFPFFFLCYIVT